MATNPNILVIPMTVMTPIVRILDDEKPNEFGKILDEDWIKKGELYAINKVVDRSIESPDDPFVYVLGDKVRGGDLQPNAMVWSIHPRRMVIEFVIYNN